MTGQVTTKDALKFCDDAMRNWGRVNFDNDGLEDLRVALDKHRIAAQAELLEAWLEWFEASDELAELERNYDTTKKFDMALWAQSEAENKARAAIAKAKGEA